MDLINNRLPESVVESEFLETAFFGLNHLGFIVTSNQSKWHFLKGLICSVIFISHTLGQFWYALTEKDTGIMVVYGSIGFCLVSAGIRLFYFFLINQKEFFELVSDLDADLRNTKGKATPSENAIIRGYYTYAWRLSTFLVRSTHVSILLLFIIHLWKANFNPIRTLGGPVIPPLFQNRWPFDNLPFSNFYVNLYNIVSVYIALRAVPSIHGLLCVMTTFVVMNLRLLNHKLEHIHDYVTEKDVLKRNEQANQLLVECVQRHLYIMGYLQKLQDMGGKFLFFDFIIYSTQLCFMLYQIVTATDIAVQVFNVNYVSTLVGVLWLYYYHGNEITYHSDLISTSIYLSNWYDFDMKFRKTMLQLMTNSYEPMKMYAGIIEVNIPNFIGIMKAGYSYLTILRHSSN